MMLLLFLPPASSLNPPMVFTRWFLGEVVFHTSYESPKAVLHVGGFSLETFRLHSS